MTTNPHSWTIGPIGQCDRHAGGAATSLADAWLEALAAGRAALLSGALDTLSVCIDGELEALLTPGRDRHGAVDPTAVTAALLAWARKRRPGRRRAPRSTTRSDERVGEAEHMFYSRCFAADRSGKGRHAASSSALTREAVVTSPTEHRVTQARADAAAIDGASDVLRRIAQSDMHTSRARGEVGVAVAGLLEAAARCYRELPADVARRALSVVAAVDRAQNPITPRPPGAAT